MRKNRSYLSDKIIEIISIYPHKLFNTASKNSLIMKEHFDVQNTTGIIIGNPSFLRMKISQSIDFRELKFSFQMNDENNVPVNIVGLSSEYEFIVKGTPKIFKWIKNNFISDIFIRYCQEVLAKKNTEKNTFKYSVQYFVENSEEYSDHYLLYSEKISNIFGYNTYYAIDKNINSVKQFIHASTMMKSNLTNPKNSYLYKFPYIQDYEYWIKL